MTSITDEVLALRKEGGYCRHLSLATVAVHGADAARFLQARLSSDVLALAPGQSQATCLLDGKAKILFRGSLHCLAAEHYLLLSDKTNCHTAHAELERTLFRERVLLSQPQECIAGLHGAKSALFAADAQRLGLLTLPAEMSGEPGLFVLHDEEAWAAIDKHARALDMVPISEQAWQLACLEAGDPGFELQGVLLPETGLEVQAASYTKGCFPGQEVLARVRTYGATKRGLVGLVFDDVSDVNPKPTLAGKMECAPAERCARVLACTDGTTIGSIHKLAYSPTLGKTIALAFLDRSLAVFGSALELSLDDLPPQPVTIRALPFYSSADKKPQAQKLYLEALQEFAAGSEPQAIDMLKSAIQLDPLHADAYESLGVILGRNDRLDEAVTFMKQLAVLAPDSIMAHANLSVFYMQQGDKEKAEEEKAIAMSIRMSEIARQAANQQQQDEERSRQKEAAQQRMQMFKEVLAIDPDDFLANAGLGTVYIDLDQHEQAVAHLLKAIDAKPTHTVAYVSLGEAYEKLGQTAHAVEAYNKGIAVAARRGDGEPMKKMQARLKELTAVAG